MHHDIQDLHVGLAGRAQNTWETTHFTGGDTWRPGKKREDVEWHNMRVCRKQNHVRGAHFWGKSHYLLSAPPNPWHCTVCKDWMSGDTNGTRESKALLQEPKWIHLNLGIRIFPKLPDSRTGSASILVSSPEMPKRLFFLASFSFSLSWKWMIRTIPIC